jgi:putative ABC transport system substrate-binding protein
MRRTVIFLGLSALLLALSVSTSAQQPKKVARIGFLRPTVIPAHFYAIFRQGMRELGYVEGKNLITELRSAESQNRLLELATELVQQKVDVIVTPGGAAAAAKIATATVPIVFSFSGDPVEAGLVESVARPGGNLTGITWLAFELVGKRLELLKEAVAKLSRVAVLANPSHPGEQRELKETENTARALGISLQYHQVRNTADFEPAFNRIVNQSVDALLVFPESVTLRHSKQIAEFAVKHRMASVFAWTEYVEDGGLMAYGPDRNETLKRLAVYVDKILKGTKPTELPVELPRKFDFVINLKTAKQIGLTIPPNVLARADNVIK